LIREGWSPTNLEGVTYRGIHETPHTEWDSALLRETEYGPGEVWQKTFTAGTVEMRGNGGGDGSYVMFVANPANPPTPPSFWVQHLADNMKCNGNEGLVYVADQAACEAHATANGHPFYSFRHNVDRPSEESTGLHKCFSSTHCDSPLTETGNEWRVYTNQIVGPITHPPPMCCLALTAECLACAVGQTVSQYCAENPGTSGCVSIQPVYDCALSAYWEHGNCGCANNDFQADWCGGIGSGVCPETRQVDPALCPSGIAYLVDFNGVGGSGSGHRWNYDGCDYIWHAQYACQQTPGRGGCWDTPNGRVCG